MENKHNRAIFLYSIALFAIAMAGGLGGGILTNYYNEVYHLDSAARGFLEIPRETPGILCMILISLLSFMKPSKIAIIAMLANMIGLFVMAFSPIYVLMIIFLFIQSLGDHLFMPIQDTLSLSLSSKGKEGSGLGRFKSISTTGSLLAAALVFICFKNGYFSYLTRPILPFMIACGLFAIAIILLLLLSKEVDNAQAVKRQKLVFKKEYFTYYLVTFTFGCQKRIRIVYAPWVLVTLLNKGADTLALLTIVIRLLTIVIAPYFGKLIDKLGASNMLKIEGIFFILTFVFMGLVTTMIIANVNALLIFLSYVGYILCTLTDQFNMVHAYLIKSLTKDSTDITQALSQGVSMDHIMAIIASPILGIIWNIWGAQYVFYIAALSSLIQLYVGFTLKDR